MSVDRRIEYIDIAKGIGILLVIWGHIKSGGWTGPFIYSFHIPMFFILAGMMFNRSRYSSFREFIRKRFWGLLVPYAIYSVLSWVVWVGYNLVLKHTAADIWRPLLQTVIAQGSGGFLVHNVPLWFVTCLFTTEVLYYFVSRLPEKYNIIVCCISLAAGWLLIEEFKITLLPWNLEVALVAVFFYAVGNEITKHFSLDQIQKTIKANSLLFSGITAVLVFLTFIGSQSTGHISLGSDNLGNNFLLFVVDALSGSFTVIIACVLISGNKHLSAINNFLKYLGLNSFRYMAIHNPVKGFIVVIVAKLFSRSDIEVCTNYFYFGIAFISTLVITSLIVAVINRFPQKIRRFL